MIVVTIILGLIGLGIVVLVHELGHLAAAKASGVEVEAFSIGWGPRIAGWKKGGTDWRISAFPIGGYCRMKGEEAFARALQDKAETIPRDPGTFYGAPAWKRILISISGPLANVVFAAVVFIVVSAVGYTEKTYGNRIVLASEFRLDSSIKAGSLLPADLAGLRSGDRIVAADGKAIRDYVELQEAISINAEKRLVFTVEREGQTLEIPATPALDKETGAGRLGIYSWIDPVVATVTPGSAAAIAGMRPGDVITAIDGKPVRHGIEALAFLAGKPQKTVFSLLRDGASLDLTLVLSYTNGASDLGVNFRTLDHVVRSTSAQGALRDGLSETWKIFSVSVQGLATLFRGVNVLKAVSGPARITYLVGRTATEGIAASGPEGLVLVFNFLAFLSVALFIMNLLPIPALDGGMILLFLVEILRNRPLKTKTVYRFQMIGMTFILALFVLASVSDLFYFSGK